MTELEDRLINLIKDHNEIDWDRIRKSKSEMRYIIFPIVIEGSFDKIVKDTLTNEYELHYNYIKKDSISLFGFPMANTEDIETRKINITDLVNSL